MVIGKWLMVIGNGRSVPSLQVGRRGFVVDCKIEKGEWETAVSHQPCLRLASGLWLGDNTGHSRRQRPQQQAEDRARAGGKGGADAANEWGLFCS
ncbi:MAG: hypothetical protein M5U34_01025 [Chloroflexi bacterium]|nr:hypothetical protein [Chloroflexota bacterium]